MDAQFAVDDSGMTADGYHILNPVSMKAMYIANAIKFGISAVAVFLLVHFSGELFGEAKDYACMVIIGLYIVLAAYLIAGPAVFYRRYRYRIDDDKVEIRRGIVTITHTLVPIERIHQVQVAKGPINRMFGLANVVITTAGGVTTLEYLDETTAEGIASKLNEYVVKLLKDRD